MSRAGCPYDNAMAESFMKTLKTEEVDASNYRDLVDARTRVGGFIATIYNTERLHSALGYRSPEEYEAQETNISTLSTAARPATPRSTPTTTTVPI